jgi:23S rRNA-/tRNA-specific pseudouridylate synthase
VHQVRIHLASLGCPLVGDEFYGPWGAIKPDRANDIEPRHALHAESITFRHPITAAPLTCTAPMPPDMRALIGDDLSK